MDKLITKIKSTLNPFLASVDGFSSHGSDEIKILRIRTTNNYLITFINSKDKDYWIDTERDGAVIFDKNFNILKNFFLKTHIDLDNESYDSENFVNTTLKILKVLTLKKKSDGQKMLDQIFIFKLKKLLIKECGLEDNLDKDYFLFGDDEFRIRYYKDIPSLKTIHNRLVKINDKSAILFFEDGKANTIDMLTGICWATKTKLYPNIRPKMIPATKKDHEFSRHSSKDNKATYWKNAKPSKEELKCQETVKIQEANGMIFKLVKIKGKFMLEELKTKNLIAIGHPDLLITLV